MVMKKVSEFSKSLRFHKPLGITSQPEKFNVNDNMVIRVLRDYCRDGCECWPRIETLAEDTMISQASVYRSLTKLEKAGFLTRKKHEIGQDKRRQKFVLNLEKICFQHPIAQSQKPSQTETYLPLRERGKNEKPSQTETHLPLTVIGSYLSEGEVNGHCIIEEKSNLRKHSKFFLLPGDVPDEKKKKILSLIDFFEEEVARQRAGQEVSEDWILAGQRWLVEMAPVLEDKGQRPHHGAEIQELVRRFLGSDQKYFEKQLAYALSGGYRLPIEHISKQEKTKNESESYREPAFPVYRCGQK